MPALDSRQWCLQQNKKEEEEEYPKLSDNGNKQIKKECIISIGYPPFLYLGFSIPPNKRSYCVFFELKINIIGIRP